VGVVGVWVSGRFGVSVGAGVGATVSPAFSGLSLFVCLRAHRRRLLLSSHFTKLTSTLYFCRLAARGAVSSDVEITLNVRFTPLSSQSSLRASACHSLQCDVFIFAFLVMDFAVQVLHHSVLLVWEKWRML
jgi:hypothetical protein